MASLALFEDAHWQNFAPISLTKPTFDIKVGARTYFEEYVDAPDYLLTREYLAGTTHERHPNSKVNLDSLDADTIFVNGLLHPGAVYLDRLSNISHNFAITSGNRLLLARLGRKGGEYLASCVQAGRKISIKKLQVDKSTDLGMHDAQGLLSNPWDIISAIENSLSMQVSDSAQSDESIPPGVKTIGSGKVIIGHGATLEEGTVLDTRKGGINVGPEAQISPCRITGPAYISGATQIKQFTLIEASFIGYNCRISGEVEHSVISDHSNKAHDGFLGHSYVGEWVNIGAMTTTSDLKMTYGNIKMVDGLGKKVDTGTNKVGSFLGDMCKTSIGTLIYSGRRVGVSSHLHGLVAQDVPSFSIYGSSIGTSNVELEFDSALETQKKVMSRRNQRLTKAFEEMMRHVFSMTVEERKKKKVRRAKFTI
jgi:UDP-N-acetylglucosamine diphosphorylase/glucosamine-1-phosphate N-acetyltransferase